MRRKVVIEFTVDEKREDRDPFLRELTLGEVTHEHLCRAIHEYESDSWAWLYNHIDNIKEVK